MVAVSIPVKLITSSSTRLAHALTVMTHVVHAVKTLPTACPVLMDTNSMRITSVPSKSSVEAVNAQEAVSTATTMVHATNAVTTTCSSKTELNPQNAEEDAQKATLKLPTATSVLNALLATALFAQPTDNALNAKTNSS